MSSGTTEERRGLAPVIVLGGLILLALVLRLYKLGHWGFEGDEIFTLRDSLHPKFDNPRPLLYLLNYYVVRPFIPLDELGLRLIPALSGILAVPVFYVVARLLVGTRAALFGALLLTVSAVHVYQSQYARYWSLVFLFSSIYPYALYLGVTRRKVGLLALGIAAAVLAVLSHPVAVLPFGGLSIWLLATYFQPASLARSWRQRNFRWAVLAIVLLAVAIAVRYWPVLAEWIATHRRGSRRRQPAAPSRPAGGKAARAHGQLRGGRLRFRWCWPV